MRMSVCELMLEAEGLYNPVDELTILPAVEHDQVPPEGPAVTVGIKGARVGQVVEVGGLTSMSRTFTAKVAEHPVASE